MALFGAPLADEEHSLAACCAALDIQSQLVMGTTGIKIRVGIHSGEFVVHPLQVAQLTSLDAAGAVVHLAARLQQTAEPGAVWTSGSTIRLAAARLQTEALGTRRLRGFDTPVEVHRLLAADASLTRLDVAGRRDLSPFVGRSDERRCLESRFEQILEGEGAAVAIIGDAGIGKTRLVREFVAEIGAAVPVLEARGVRWRASSGFYAFGQIARRVVGPEGSRVVSANTPAIPAAAEALLGGRAGRGVAAVAAEREAAADDGSLCGSGRDLARGEAGYGNVETAIDMDGVNATDFADTLIGDARGNSFRPLGGNDYVDGGSGIDTVRYNTRNVEPIRGANVDLATGIAIDPYGGTDTLVSIENLQGIDFTNVTDTLAGDGLANRLEGLIGNDSLAGRAGDDTLAGGLGNDSIDGGEGRDLIDFSGATAAVNAVVRNGLMTDGQGGTDSVTGIEGAVGSRFDDTLSTSDAGGILYGEAGNDRLIGDSGADNLRGGAGLDTLTGGAGQDTLSGFSGSDSLDGGAGNDMLDFSAATAGVNVDLDNATVADGQGGTDSFTGFEDILGSGFADTMVGRTEDAGVLLGQGGNDEIFGWNGADSLDGGAGADTLWGGIGNDMLTGGDGSNLLLGEDGEDVANYMAFAPTSLVLRQETDGATVVEHFGADGISTGIDRLFDIERILTSDGLLQLGNPEEVFKATNAAGESTLLLGTVYSGPVLYLEKQLFGGGGGEIVGGSSRNDFINTFGGDDAIDAGAGNDVLDGGTGSNFMTGGAGFDVFFSDGRGGTTTWSTITDWQAGEQLSLWGYRPGVSQLLWLESDGAEGYKGVTLHADLDGNGVIDTSVTWSGLTFADLPPALEYDGLLWFQ